MQTIDEIITATYEIKKSTFLSFLCPVSEFKALHERLKAEHPKAAHVVWAYRELNGYGQIVSPNFPGYSQEYYDQVAKSGEAKHLEVPKKDK